MDGFQKKDLGNSNNFQIVHALFNVKFQLVSHQFHQLSVWKLNLWQYFKLEDIS